ncbi:IclR family transcriptional regulator [Bordetella petrii]|uniref:IclR family transcriptional regulator n=1 Tax=Bordetella petrii TaxID=94624 RepID=UPI001E3CDD15|nr:IclR family transcriptional regulator [Bordetella petrii]MCD0501574.1 IclR family transcriptional regulator [Bordetella petrii]
MAASAAAPIWRLILLLQIRLGIVVSLLVIRLHGSLVLMRRCSLADGRSGQSFSDVETGTTIFPGYRIYFHMPERNNTTLSDGLRLIDLLANAQHPQPLTMIAAALGMGNSKAHRLLQTLMQAQYVMQEPGTRRYYASIKLWTLGSAVLRQMSLRTAAEGEMLRLMETTGESVHLSVLEEHEIVYVHKVESDNPVRAYSQIGGRMPAALVATGKAMLAFLSADDQARIHAQLPHGEAGHGDIQAAFLREMQLTRAKRVAVNRGEWRKDVYGVASPILNHDGRAVAAIGVSGPAHRFKRHRIAFFAREVIRSADAIAMRLFGEPPQRVWSGKARQV